MRTKMEATIRFKVKNEEEFKKEMESSILPEEVWELWDEEGKIIYSSEKSNKKRKKIIVIEESCIKEELLFLESIKMSVDPERISNEYELVENRINYLKEKLNIIKELKK